MARRARSILLQTSNRLLCSVMRGLKKTVFGERMCAELILKSKLNVMVKRTSDLVVLFYRTTNSTNLKFPRCTTSASVLRRAKGCVWIGFNMWDVVPSDGPVESSNITYEDFIEHSKIILSLLFLFDEWWIRVVNYHSRGEPFEGRSSSTVGGEFTAETASKLRVISPLPHPVTAPVTGRVGNPPVSPSELFAYAARPLKPMGDPS